MIKLQYLGTSAAEGWPAPFCPCEACERARQRGAKNIRTRSQAIIDDRILLDLPGDTLAHANRFGIDLTRVNHLLVTHAHLDHFSAFDLHLRMDPYQKGAAPMEVYCNDAVYQAFIRSLEFYLMHYREHIHFHIVHAFDAFDIGAYHVQALRADHTPTEECLFYRVSGPGGTILYAHDTGVFPEDTWERLEGKHNDIVSLDCTYCLQDCTSRHMGLSACAQVKDRMLQCGMADQNTLFIINHFTHNCAQHCGHEELEEAAKQLGFLTAYDGMVVTGGADPREERGEWRQ